MQINLNILTENNHSSLLSKNVPTADNALLQYMQKVTQGTNNADTEDKKQQKLQPEFLYIPDPCEERSITTQIWFWMEIQ